MENSYTLPTMPDEMLKLNSQTRSTGFQGGRSLNTGATAQGGGAILGGGIGGPPVSAWLGFWNHRGFLGGPGVRTGGHE